MGGQPSAISRGCTLAVLAVLLGAAPVEKTEEKPPVVKERVEIAGERFALEVAADDESRQRGLAGREQIDPDGGMLFIFPDARRRAFWMKDCLVDIDLLYLDDRGRIVRTYEMKAEPPRGENEHAWAYERRLTLYRSRRPIRFVIELRAGTIDRLELEPGRAIELDLPRLKKLAEKPGQSPA